MQRPKHLINGNILVGLTLATSIFGALASRVGPHVPRESCACTQLNSQLREPDTGFLDTPHLWSNANPFAFAAKTVSAPDNPTLKGAMLSPAASEFKEAMGIEITALEKNATWT
jgi:hypothetical protein